MTSALERTRDRGREHRAAGGGRGRSPRPRRTGCRTPRGLVVTWGRFSYNTYPIAPWLSTHSYVLAVLHPR